MSSEDELIRRIARAIPSFAGARVSSRDGLRLGIGDDAAVIGPRGRSDWVVSCDAFVEGTHFLAEIHPADSVGFKSLARATSDLAAMGATPRLFLLTLTLPANRTGKWLNEFLHGMGRAARQLGMRLVGGDTTKSPTVSISITVLGEVAPGLAVRRSGARPGDIIYVSGKLGQAEMGFLMVKNDLDLARKQGFNGHLVPIQRHLYPQIRVRLGSWLAERRITSAMMDISDGLSTDLSRLCAASKVGARIWAARIPCVEIPTGKSGKLERVVARMNLDPLRLALHGGEDYELLFTVPPKDVKRLRRAPGFSEITPIGEIERGSKVLLVGEDGVAAPLRSGGWDPFRKK
jgi:thiamine-monophosphate kinase